MSKQELTHLAKHIFLITNVSIYSEVKIFFTCSRFSNIFWQVLCCSSVPNLVPLSSDLCTHWPSYNSRVTYSHVCTNIRTHTRTYTHSTAQKNKLCWVRLPVTQTVKFLWFVGSPSSGDILPSWGTGKLTSIWWQARAVSLLHSLNTQTPCHIYRQHTHTYTHTSQNHHHPLRHWLINVKEEQTEA